MTTHLSSQEFVDALEGGLEASRERHLDVCGQCQTEVEALRAVIAEVETDVDTPEPSPLFWDHFQSRVHAAVRAEAGAQGRLPWWQMVPGMTGAASLRTWLTAGATLAAVVMVVAIAVRGPATAVPPVDTMATATRPLTAVDVPEEAAIVTGNAQWEFVSGMLATLDDDGIRQVLRPTKNAVDAAMGNLSDEERERFLRLVQAEMVEGLE